MTIISARHAASALALVLALGLAGCETSDMVEKVQESVQDFNPFGTAKKKLPGTRKPVFPEGVPGVEQGVPPDLLVGAQQPADATPSASAQRSGSEARPKPKATARRKPRPTPAQREARPADAEGQPSAGSRAKRRAPQTAGPASTPSQSGAAWPEPSAQQTPTKPAQAAGPGSTSWPAPPTAPPPTVWPDPPQTGSFTR